MDLDEIFAAMPEEAAADGRDYLIINPATRTISVPDSQRLFGVETDEGATRKYFLCPRYVGDSLDLASMFLTVNYRNANGDEDGHLVTDVEVQGDNITFSWPIASKVVAYKGTIQFSVCAELPNTARRRGPDWNTAIAKGDVLEGLDPDRGTVEAETSDVVAQLRAMVTAQTAAVEATGATQAQNVQTEGNTQVNAVKATGAQETATARAAIEAKGEAVLASIPADYATLAGKVNEFANAIKGRLSGEIVQAGDVSPVEHFLGVRVRGKNLFDTSKIPTATPSVSYAYVSEAGVGRIVVRTEEGYDGNGYCTVAKTLREVCPSLEVGKTYVLTASTESNSTNMYLPGIQKSWIFGQAMVMTEAVLNSAMTFYGLSAREGMGTGDCTISNIQIEEGTEATEYTPYIDPAGVTVTRCGKNLLNREAMKSEAVLNGVTITRDGDLLTLSGTLTTDSVLFSTPFFLHGVLGDYYTLSYKHIGGTVEGASSVCVGDCDAPGAARQSWANIKMLNKDNGLTFQMVKPYIKDLWFYSTAGVVFNEYKIKIQLEPGKSATVFEPYNAATAMPDESGAVAGLPSLAPTMTLLTDTAGVNIECVYNRDTNAVLAEILERIATLGG